MKAKIFAKLKQEYSYLGLGDEVLLAVADSLSSIGLVTDDNIDAVVACQRKSLEAQQKSNDKRVGEALEKERRKHDEEAAAKAKADAEAAAIAEAERKKADEAARKQKEKEEAAAKESAAREAERKQLEKSPQIPTDLVALLTKEREESQRRLNDVNERFEQMMAEMERRNKESGDTLSRLQQSYDELLENHKTLSVNYDSMKKENDQAKADKARAQRENFIISKARELGVPDYRIEEGFVIAPDADEAAITSVLTRVADNIRTQQLPTNRSIRTIPDEEVTELDIEALAKSIVR